MQIEWWTNVYDYGMSQARFYSREIAIKATRGDKKLLYRLHVKLKSENILVELMGKQ